MSLKFIKNKEDFVCDNCGREVEGNGYTNHCPDCLWSKHVDINPGDRKESCGGMMKPVKIESDKEKQKIVHKCVRCGIEKRNSVSKNDSFKKILEIIKKFSIAYQ